MHQHLETGENWIKILMKTFFFFFGELKEVSLHHLENTPNSLKRVHSE